MPVIVKPKEIGLEVAMPILGIQFWVEDESEIHNASQAFLKIFCAFADKHGKGLDAELKELGLTEHDDYFDLDTKEPALINFINMAEWQPLQVAM